MHHNLIIKDGDTTKVAKEVLVDGVQFVDEKPRAGSTNPVTSGGVANTVTNVLDDHATASEDEELTMPTAEAANYTVGNYFEQDGEIWKCTAKTDNGDGTWTIEAEKVNGVVPALNEKTTDADVQRIINDTPNIKNVQSDWDETDNTKYEFIKNKPYFRKNVESSRIFKVCSFAKRATTAQDAEGIDVIYRRGGGAVFGTLLHKVGFELRLCKVDDISVNASTIHFYWVEESGRIQLYANDLAYCNLTAAPICNIPKSRINFDNFGVEVPSLPEGAIEIIPVWSAASTGSSGDTPVKVNDYGLLSPVTMDAVPTEGSTNLITSGAIKAALDQLSTRIAALE